MKVSQINFNDKNAPENFTKSLKSSGFAVLNNHPISKDLIKLVYNDWSKFFKSNDKNHYLFDKIKQDGYFPYKTENAKGFKSKDLKEFYHYYPWGKSPKKLSNSTLILYNQLIELASTLLEWIELSCPERIKNRFSIPLNKMIKNSDSNLFRIIHYPPISQYEITDSIRAAPHEDINLITILIAGTEPGLQLKDKKGDWLNVDTNIDSIIINIGDMLSEVSGNYFPSTTHQVTNPNSKKTNVSRFSMPLFLHPKKSTVLSERYTAEKFLEERLKEIGLKD